MQAIALFEVYLDNALDKNLGLFGQNGSKLWREIINLFFLQTVAAISSA
jgi:hypothetical protein